jgi:hypothetical protein
MPTRALGRRVGRLTQSRLAEPVGRIVIIEPETWPSEVREAYDAACAARDLEREADIIEAQTGERPVFRREGVSVIRNHRPDIAVIEVRRTRGGDFADSAATEQ